MDKELRAELKEHIHQSRLLLLKEWRRIDRMYRKGDTNLLDQVQSLEILLGHIDEANQALKNYHYKK